MPPSFFISFLDSHFGVLRDPHSPRPCDTGGLSGLKSNLGPAIQQAVRHACIFPGIGTPPYLIEGSANRFLPPAAFWAPKAWPPPARVVCKRAPPLLTPAPPQESPTWSPRSWIPSCGGSLAAGPPSGRVLPGNSWNREKKTDTYVYRISNNKISTLRVWEEIPDDSMLFYFYGHFSPLLVLPPLASSVAWPFRKEGGIRCVGVLVSFEWFVTRVFSVHEPDQFASFCSCFSSLFFS